MPKRRIHGRKIEPGRCTVCGCAVVSPGQIAVLPDGTHSGHYVLDGELWDVRCLSCLPSACRGHGDAWPTQWLP
ncbi:MAG: hypothetical protein QG586_384 [Pseudomonadota bacterium]|nr:hypothetical protein [Pseudomonadota bacterium]